MGNFDVAEEAAQEAFAVAAEQWRTAGPRVGLALIEVLTKDLAVITCCIPRTPACCVASENFKDAATSYARALALVTHEAERRFLERRLREVGF